MGYLQSEFREDLNYYEKDRALNIAKLTEDHHVLPPWFVPLAGTINAARLKRYHRRMCIFPFLLWLLAWGCRFMATTLKRSASHINADINSFTCIETLILYQPFHMLGPFR